MSDTKKNWLDKTGVIHLWNTIKALLDTKVDKIEGLGLSSNDYTVEDKTKVSKIKPIQNTLTSTDTEAGLSAAQGKVLKDIVDTKADNINVQPITIPTIGWGTENGVSAYPNYIDIPLAGVSSKDAVVIDISPSSAYFAAQAQFTNTESMNGAVRIRAKNVPTAAIKGQWYVIHGGGSVYEGELHNYYDKAAMDKLLAGKLDIKPDSAERLGLGLEIDGSGKIGTSFYNRGHVTDANEARNPGWYSISANTTNAPTADVGQILALNSPGYVWPCQVFVSSFAGGLYYRAFDGTNWNAWMAAGIVASGSNFVRFGDGTQICWGRTTPARSITSTEKYISFPLPFSENANVLTCSNANMGGTPVQVGWETSTGFTIGGGWNGIEASGGSTSWIAIGRWK